MVAIWFQLSFLFGSNLASLQRHLVNLSWHRLFVPFVFAVNRRNYEKGHGGDIRGDGGSHNDNDAKVISMLCFGLAHSVTKKWDTENVGVGCRAWPKELTRATRRDTYAD